MIEAMRMRAATLFIALCVMSCDSKPVDQTPSKKELVGIWECVSFPETFLKEVGESPGSILSQITILADGTLTANKLPERDPYRFIEISRSSWSLADPSVTPSGSWSLSFKGQHLQCRGKGDELILRLTISGMDNYYADYRRKTRAEQKPE